MAKENRAYQRLKRLYPAAHWQRLESWTGTGIMDVNGCMNGREIWVECKEGAIRKRDNAVITKVRPAQIAWEHLRRAAGGKTYVALMLGNDMHIFPGHMLSSLRCYPLAQFALYGISPKEIFS